MAENDVKLAVTTRTAIGGRANWHLRLESKVPGIVYGLKKDPVNVTFDHRTFFDLLHAGAQLLQLSVDGKPDELVLIKDVQRDSIGDRVLHVDFNRVDIHRKIRVPLRLELREKPVGVVEGGVLDHVTMEIEVECLPLDIPREALRVNVSAMKIGDVLHIRELQLPAKLAAVTPGDTVIATVKLPLAKDEGEAVAEPEIITKGKGEVEGAAAAEAPKKDAKK